MKLINKIEDYIFLYERPCSHYIPHMRSRYQSLSFEQERDRTILFSAVEALFMAENVMDIVGCMSDITSSCSRLLRYGSRKITAIERKNQRKDGVNNG